MRMSGVRTDAECNDFMTEPTPQCVRLAAELEGDIIGVGASGKMGTELMETLVRADAAAGRSRRILAASTFSEPAKRVRLESLGVGTLQGDLSDEGFVRGLPPAPNVLFMAGFKFGSSADYRKAYLMNVIVPYLVADRYRASRIVVFSSCNIYRHVAPATGGATEGAELDPKGIYGWTVLGRENAFSIIAERHGTRVCLYRLSYAQHLAYGVLVDIARCVWAGEPVNAPLPFVNLISQRDANDAAIRCLGLCDNPPRVLNVCGPVVAVTRIADRMGEVMGRRAVVKAPMAEESLIANDARAVGLFGPARDTVEEMVDGVARWVMAGGTCWNKPTGFGSAAHKY